MNIQDRQESLVNEAKALQFFYSISSAPLVESIQALDTLLESTEHVPAEDFIKVQNDIDSEIEALCITHKISQECLEGLMHVNHEFKKVVLA